MNDIIADPGKTYAVVVGAEQYRESGWKVAGTQTADSAVAFCESLLRRGVPAEHIQLLLSTSRSVDIPEGINALKPPTRKNFRDAIIQLRERAGDLFVCYWCGHGALDGKRRQRLYFSDAWKDDPLNLDFEEMLLSLGTDWWHGPRAQLFLIDACRLPEWYAYPFQTPGEHFPAGKIIETAQGVVRAVSFHRAATPGVLWKALRPVLEVSASWPPDLSQIQRDLEQSPEFSEQTKDQRPVLSLLNWDSGKHEDPLKPYLDALDASRREALSGRERSLPSATAINNFIKSYLGDATNPEPFGGRGVELETLSMWLMKETAPPYYLLTGRPGSGKSALLVRWVDHLAQASQLGECDWEVLFLPISIRHELNTSQSVFRALIARLARLHGDQQFAIEAMDGSQLREEFSSYLQREAPEGKRLLVVLDGLDEAAGWKVSPALFPHRPAPGVRVVASARLTWDHPDTASWRAQLGWDSDATATECNLGPLSRRGTRDVLRNMGAPLGSLVNPKAIVDKLHELSQGDPLVLSLYVKELWKQESGSHELTVEILKDLQPGLEGFFARWWLEQEQLWGEGVSRKSHEVRIVLNLLALSFGPIERRDLLALARTFVSLDGDDLNAALKILTRFVIRVAGRDAYVLAHPRFASYRTDQLKSDGDLHRFDDVFLAWGRDVLAAWSEEHALRPNSSYIVRYYGAHLQRSRCSAIELIPLASDAWRAAWESLPDAYGGFVVDLERVAAAVCVENRDAVVRGSRAPLLGDAVCCALMKADANAVIRLVRPEMLSALVRNGVWTIDRAFRYLNQLEDDFIYAAALVAVAENCTQARIPDLLREVEEARISDPEDRGAVLAAVCRRLIELGCEIQAVELVSRQLPGYARGCASIEIYNRRSSENQRQVLDDILEDVENSSRDSRKFSMLLEKLTQTIPPPVQSDVSEIDSKNLDFQATIQRVHPRLRRIMLLLKDREGVIKYLAYIANWIPESLRSTLLSDALERYASRERYVFQTDVIADLAKYLKGDLLIRAIDSAKQMPKAGYLGAALAALLPNMDQQQRSQADPLIESVLPAAAKVGDESVRCRFFANIARSGLAEQAIRNLANREPNDWDVATIWKVLAPHLNERQVRQGLALLPKVRLETRERAASALISRLATFGREQARQALTLISGGDYQEECAVAEAWLEFHARNQGSADPRPEDLFRLTAVSNLQRRAVLLALAATAIDEVHATSFVEIFRSFYESSEGRTIDAEYLAMDAVRLLSPILAPTAVAAPEVINVLKSAIRGISHTRKELIILPYFRRLAETAGPAAAIDFGLSMADGFEFPIAWSIAGAADYLEGASLSQAHELCQRLELSDVKAMALAAVIPRLTGINPEEHWETVLESLSMHEVRQRSLRIAVMLNLLPVRLRDVSVARLLDNNVFAGHSDRMSNWYEAVEVLAAFLPEAKVRKCLKVMSGIESATDRKRVEAALWTRLLQLGHTEEVMDLMETQLTWMESLRPALTNALPFIPDRQLKRAMKCSFRVLDSEERLWLWPALYHRWPKISAAELLEVVELWLESSTGSSTRDVLLDLAGMARAVTLLGNRQSTSELMKKLQSLSAFANAATNRRPADEAF